MKTFRLLSLTALVAIAAAASAGTVYSNAPGGDKIVGFGTSGSTPNNSAPLANAPGWFYNNVRQDGTAGIDTTYARNGNGSFHMTGTSGTAKADLEYYNFNTPGDRFSGFKSMGTLASLSTLSYDWYRAASSTVAGHLMPALRVAYDADGDFSTSTDRGFLVFERVYNGNPVAGPSVPTNAWQSDDVSNAKVWMTNTGNPKGSVLSIYDRTFADWATSTNPNSAYPSLNNGAVIYGLSMGSGSGWAGKFDGAVDNVTIGFGGNSTTYNFETQPVPEPASVAALGLGALGLVRRRRAKRA